jgi:hypothetical protein
MLFTQIRLYIQSKTDLYAKIQAIEQLIDNVLLQGVDSVDTINNTEYYLDNGQNKISLKYRSPTEVFKTIEVLERTKQIYVNRLNGRTSRLIDSKNLNQTWLNPPC